MEATAESLIQISEIQHYAFCPRQWGLIHLEGHWAENVLTVEGQALHKRAHDGELREKRGNRIIVRGMKVASSRLGITGACDVIEFISDKHGIFIPSYEGTFRVVPVEYKHGKPKEGEEDLLQLTLQALCLEEMLVTDIPVGYFYYGIPRRRMKAELTQELKEHAMKMLTEIHQYLKRGYTPKVKRKRGCFHCSLTNLCFSKAWYKKSAKAYVEKKLLEADGE